jgi:ubiquitin-protein ligase
MSSSIINEPPRRRRLWKDYQQLKDLSDNSDLIKIEQTTGNPPEKYVVRFNCRGIASIDGSGNPQYSELHRIGILFPQNYPLQMPQLQWLTPIFHPNILAQRVCIGPENQWPAAESLDQLCIVLGRMIQYKIYNLNSVLNQGVPGWVKSHRHMLPVDDRPLRRGMPNAQSTGDTEIRIEIRKGG